MKTRQIRAALGVLLMLGLGSSAAADPLQDSPPKASPATSRISETERSLLAALSSPVYLAAEALTAPALPSDVEAGELTAAFQRARDLAAVVAEGKQLEIAARAQTEAAARGFVIDAALRISESVFEKDDTALIGILGDGYTRQSQIHSAWRAELLNRHVARSIHNRMVDDLTTFADARFGAATAAAPKSRLEFAFVGSGRRIGALRIINRGEEALDDVMFVVRIRPQAQLVSRMSAVEDYGVFPLFVGATVEAVEERQRVNELYRDYLAGQVSAFVHVTSLPKSLSLEVPIYPDPRALLLAEECEVCCWGGGMESSRTTVGGLTSAKKQIAAFRTVPEQRELIAQSRQLAQRDPAEALRRLKIVERSSPDATIETERKAVHDPIVRDLDARRDKLLKEIEELDADLQRKGSEVAASPKDARLRDQYERLKKQKQAKKDEAQALKEILELR